MSHAKSIAPNQLAVNWGGLGLGLAWPSVPLAFLHDAARCLALVGQCRLGVGSSGRLQPGSVSRLARGSALRPACLQPRAELQAPGIAFLFWLLVEAGLIETGGGPPRLTDKAIGWLSLPAELQLLDLRQFARRPKPFIAAMDKARSAGIILDKTFS